MKQIGVASIYGDWIRSYSFFPKLMSVITHFNPGNKVHIQALPKKALPTSSKAFFDVVGGYLDLQLKVSRQFSLFQPIPSSPHAGQSALHRLDRCNHDHMY